MVPINWTTCFSKNRGTDAFPSKLGSLPGQFQQQQDQIYQNDGMYHLSGQISIIPKPELRGFWGSSLIKPPFRVTSADVVIICPDLSFIYHYSFMYHSFIIDDFWHL